MRVEQWFGKWFDRHAERHPRADWPRVEESADFYRGWIGNFVKIGATEEVAEEASVRLMADPPDHLSGHIPSMIALVKSVFRERAERGLGADPNSRESAERASLRCPDCGGQGLTLRWRRLSVGQLDSTGKPLAPSIVLYCTCPLGRWFERSHRASSPDVRKRIYDLAEHPWLQLRPTPGPDGETVLDNPYRRPPSPHLEETESLPAF